MSFTVLPEKEVVALWQKQMDRRRRLVAADGQPFEVLYPGRPNDGRGGDFRDAVILFGREVKQGCIEIHSRTSGWETHGHHHDPQYNQVILHVAWQRDSRGPTCLENGLNVPTVVLNNDASAVEDNPAVFPCRKIPAHELGVFLEKLGDIRLAEKVRYYRDDLIKAGAEQSLYAGLLEALGYSKNQQPFRYLARLAPLRSLETLVKNNHTLTSVQACLLGLAGLLPSQRGLEGGGETYIRDLENGWKQAGSVQVMSFRDWEMYRVRPFNYPVRRIIALSFLLFRYCSWGWLETWRRALRRSLIQDSRLDWCALLTVRAEGYWASHYDFNSPPVPPGSWLLGRERAAEIIVNVMLPLFIALSERQGENSLVTELKEVYDSYPACPSNSIQRHMLGQLKAGKDLLSSARRQQGLLHLYKAYCTGGRCLMCCLNG